MDVLANIRQTSWLNQHCVRYYHATYLQGKLDIDQLLSWANAGSKVSDCLSSDLLILPQVHNFDFHSRYLTDIIDFGTLIPNYSAHEIVSNCEFLRSHLSRWIQTCAISFHLWRAEFNAADLMMYWVNKVSFTYWCSMAKSSYRQANTPWMIDALEVVPLGQGWETQIEWHTCSDLLQRRLENLRVWASTGWSHLLGRGALNVTGKSGRHTQWWVKECQHMAHSATQTRASVLFSESCSQFSCERDTSLGEAGSLLAVLLLVKRLLVSSSSSWIIKAKHWKKVIILSRKFPLDADRHNSLLVYS